MIHFNQVRLTEFVILIMLGCFVPNTLGAPTLEDFRAWDQESDSSLIEAYEFMTKNSQEFPSKVEAFYKSAGVLPDDAAQARVFVDRSIQLIQVKYRFIYGDGQLQNESFVKGVWQDSSIYAPHRADAGLLLYLKTGDANYAIEAIPLAPFFFQWFAHVKDPQFATILRGVYARCTAEQISLMGTGKYDKGPYTEAIIDLYPDLARAIFFQGLDPVFATWLFDRRADFQGNSSRVIQQLQDFSPAGLRLFLGAQAKISGPDARSAQFMREQNVDEDPREMMFRWFIKEYPQLKDMALNDVLEQYLDQLTAQRDTTLELRERLAK